VCILRFLTKLIVKRLNISGTACVFYCIMICTGLGERLRKVYIFRSRGLSIFGGIKPQGQWVKISRRFFVGARMAPAEDERDFGGIGVRARVHTNLYRRRKR
jgi:hypothetical protein